MAPEWLTGPCGEACQEWISACVYARTNLYGIPVVISMRANHPALALSDFDRDNFLNQEGAFYGNYFLMPSQMFVCRGRGYDPYYMVLRACAQEPRRCVFPIVGTCGGFDGPAGVATDRQTCDGEDPAFGGAYRTCYDTPSDLGGATFPPCARPFTRPITIYLRDATFLGEPIGSGC